MVIITLCAIMLIRRYLYAAHAAGIHLSHGRKNQ